MTLHDTTLVERLSGLLPDSAVARAYRARAEARAMAEADYRRLLWPDDPGTVTRTERRAIAGFVAALIGEPQTRAHFLSLLADTDPTLARIIAREADDSAHPGPYGRFPGGSLSVEDLDGPVYAVDADLRHVLGPRLSVALEHAHLVTLHPRDATPHALERLAHAGWSDGDIAVLLEIVGLVNFQARVVAGLRAYLAARQPSLSLVG